MSTSDLSQCEWRKSSWSMSESNCVEVAWRKSSWSTSESNCVEVAAGGTLTAVRDSKNPTGPMLAFPVSSWKVFVRR